MAGWVITFECDTHLILRLIANKKNLMRLIAKMSRSTMAIGDRTRRHASHRLERFSPAQIKTSQTAAMAEDDEEDSVVAASRLLALSRPLLIKLFIKIFRFLARNNDEAANRVFSLPPCRSEPRFHGGRRYFRPLT